MASFKWKNKIKYFFIDRIQYPSWDPLDPYIVSHGPFQPRTPSWRAIVWVRSYYQDHNAIATHSLAPIIIHYIHTLHFIHTHLLLIYTLSFSHTCQCCVLKLCSHYTLNKTFLPKNIPHKHKTWTTVTLLLQLQHKHIVVRSLQVWRRGFWRELRSIGPGSTSYRGALLCYCVGRSTNNIDVCVFSAMWIPLTTPTSPLSLIF